MEKIIERVLIKLIIKKKYIMKPIFAILLSIPLGILFTQDYRGYRKVAETDTTITYKFENDTTIISKPINSSQRGIKYLEVKQTAYYKGDLIEEINRLKIFPDDAIKNKVEGTVKLHCKVDTTGKLYAPIILYSVYPSIDKEALRIIQLLPRLV